MPASCRHQKPVLRLCDAPFSFSKVPGSPFLFVVEEEGLAKAHGEGLTHGSVGQPSHFYLDAQGLVGQPTVQVLESTGLDRFSFNWQIGSEWS